MTDKFEKSKEFTEAFQPQLPNEEWARFERQETGQTYKPNLSLMANHIIQSIIQEMPESLGTTGMADAVYQRLDQIDSQNGLHPLIFENVYWLFVDNYNKGVD